MSKYSKLADRLLSWPSIGTIGTGLHEDLSEAAAALRELEAERDRLRKALKRLEYWFDTDPEVLDAMDADTRADHERQLAMIRAALQEGKGDE